MTSKATEYLGNNGISSSHTENEITKGKEKEVKSKTETTEDIKRKTETVKDPKYSKNHDYELIDNTYYYKDTVSDIQYMYDQAKGDWIKVSSNIETSVNSPNITTDNEGRVYYWAEGLYICKDSHGNSFYLDENNDWKPWSESSKNNSEANGGRWYFYKGTDTFYRDISCNKVYKLNKDNNQWEECIKKSKKKSSNYDEEFDTDEEEKTSSEEEENGSAPPGFQTDPSISYDGNTYTKYNSSDSMAYEWDPDRKAWFPKLDEDFMATYQLSYGFNPDGTKNENPLKYDDDEDEEENKSKVKTPKTNEEKSEKQKPGWFDVDDAHNKNVYVSNLPDDMTEDSFVDFMSKCGLVYRDPITQKYKIKLYTDDKGNFKGDALCTYIKVESVDLALQILDGYRLGNNTVSVERARFTLKGEYDPSLKPKKRKKKEVEKIQKKQEKLFDWRPDPLRGQRMKHENTVIFRNVFDPKEFEASAEKILTHKEAIREQAETFGPVKKVELFDRHPEGVVKVTFAEVESADMCAVTLNRRLYQNRKLYVSTWDGFEKYNIEETEEERNERIRKWEEFLEGN